MELSWTARTNMPTSAEQSCSSNWYTNSCFSVEVEPPGTSSNFTESWNGTSWTEVSDLTADRALAMEDSGTSNSRLFLSGG
jgi:hypothetical protein